MTSYAKRDAWAFAAIGAGGWTVASVLLGEPQWATLLGAVVFGTVMYCMAVVRANRKARGEKARQEATR